MLTSNTRERDTTWTSSIAKPTEQRERRNSTRSKGPWPSPEADDLIAEVYGFADLPNDWDSYGAAAPEADVIKAADVALGGLDMHKVTWKAVYPSAGGEIVLKFTFRGATVNVSIDEDEWQVSIARPGKATKYYQKSPSSADNVDWIIDLL